MLGWSGGGPHALATAAGLPERVLAAATIGSVAPFGAPGLDWTAGMGPENVEEFAAAVGGRDELGPFLARWREQLAGVTGPEVAESLGGLVDEVDREALSSSSFAEWLAEAWREGLRHSADGWVDDDLAFVRPWGFDPRSIRVPVHVWQGKDDRMVPFAHGKWLAAQMPAACAHLLDDEGHLSLAVGGLAGILEELLAVRPRRES
ncbi:MAG: alpha/beta hydrolase [Actinomycetota bacterium]|nr:alpha/beta hydrolase [Actinomycetota bacterium]